MALDGAILTHFPASKWQVLVQCKSPHLFGHWHESPRFSVFFCWLGKVVGDFFVKICGEASTGLGECDPESLQFLFSGSRVVPC